MEPNIHTGEFVIIENKANYDIGDIVTYEANDMLITHRIIEKNENSFIAQGDYNNNQDEIQEDSKIIGKVVFHSEKIGKFIRVYLKYVTVIFTIFVIFVNIYSIRKNKVEEKKKIGKTNQEIK
jgi:signal peptidase